MGTKVLRIHLCFDHEVEEFKKLYHVKKEEQKADGIVALYYTYKRRSN